MFSWFVIFYKGFPCLRPYLTHWLTHLPPSQTQLLSLKKQIYMKIIPWVNLLSLRLPLLTLPCSHSVLEKNRYLWKLTPKNIHKVISTTSYPQCHGHGYATGNTDWLQYFLGHENIIPKYYTDKRSPELCITIKITRMDFPILSLTFAWVLKIVLKLGYQPQSIKLAGIFVSLIPLFISHSISITIRYSCELTLTNIQKLISTTSHPKRHGHSYATGNTYWLHYF